MHARHVWLASCMMQGMYMVAIHGCLCLHAMSSWYMTLPWAQVNQQGCIDGRLRPIRRTGGGNGISKTKCVCLAPNQHKIMVHLLVHVNWLHVWLTTHEKLLGYMARTCFRIYIIHIDTHGAMTLMHPVIEHIYDAMVCFSDSRTSIAKHGSRELMANQMLFTLLGRTLFLCLWDKKFNF